MMIMRELTGGLYFGARETKEVDGVVTATDTLTYNENEIRRIAKRRLRYSHEEKEKGHIRKTRQMCLILPDYGERLLKK